MNARTVPLTLRQNRALAAIVQHRAMPIDVLADFLGCGSSHVYETAAALRRLGLARELTQLTAGPKWVVPTRSAVTRYFGQSLPDWTPSSLWSIRGRAAAEARVLLGATDFDAWTGERELSLERTDRGPYPYDGLMVRTSNPFALRTARGTASPVWAVRTDIARTSNPRQLAQALTRTVGQAEQDGCTSVLWVCTGAHRPETVYRTAEHIRSDLTLTATTPGELAGTHRRIRPVRDLPKGA
ncbi:hypothetical protein ACFVVM_27045 [Nocardia sp. NPDC058176]|uniref:hypothetical protein n=1 Tax=Nocardia sp. NPDC058176 TaxID=3346368 RepID=UPI0036D8C636